MLPQILIKAKDNHCLTAIIGMISHSTWLFTVQHWPAEGFGTLLKRYNFKRPNWVMEQGNYILVVGFQYTATKTLPASFSNEVKRLCERMENLNKQMNWDSDSLLFTTEIN